MGFYGDLGHHVVSDYVLLFGCMNRVAPNWGRGPLIVDKFQEYDRHCSGFQG